MVCYHQDSFLSFYSFPKAPTFCSPYWSLAIFQSLNPLQYPYSFWHFQSFFFLLFFLFFQYNKLSHVLLAAKTPNLLTVCTYTVVPRNSPVLCNLLPISRYRDLRQFLIQQTLLRLFTCSPLRYQTIYQHSPYIAFSLYII